VFLYAYAVTGPTLIAKGLDANSRYISAVGILTDNGAQAWCSPRPLVGDAPFLGDSGFAVFLDPVASAVLRLRSPDGMVAWERPYAPSFGRWAVVGYSSSPAVTAIANGDGPGLRFETAAFSSVDGRLLWTRIDSTEFRFLSRPRGAVVIGDTVFTYGNEWLDRGGIKSRIFLFAYDATTGRPLGRFTSGDTASSTVAPVALAGDRLVFGNNEGGLLAMNTRGEVLWRVPGRGIGPGQSPVIRDGIAYAASADGTTRAVDVATGTQRWVADLTYSLDGVAVCGNSVYVQMVTELWRLDRATGAITGHEADDEGGVRSRFYGPLISTADAAYAGGRGGRIYRLPC
jgi:outer membrane protein assembly factor BamB